MKTATTTIGMFIILLFLFSCGKDDNRSERFKLLTQTTWHSDSLLLNGQPAGGTGQLLEAFNGEADFRTDGTGVFGQFTGTWSFAQNETQLVINSEALPIPLTSQIVELTAQSLKITTSFPSAMEPLMIRMTFVPR
jgi:hypothetical protein